MQDNKLTQIAREALNLMMRIDQLNAQLPETEQPLCENARIEARRIFVWAYMHAQTPDAKHIIQSMIPQMRENPNDHLDSNQPGPTSQILIG